jgi:hypothetical protein
MSQRGQIYLPPKQSNHDPGAADQTHYLKSADADQIRLATEDSAQELVT